MSSTPASSKGDLVVRFARPGEKLLALNGQRIRARPRDDRDRRRGERAEPRRRDRRRGDRLHRGDDRGVHRGGAVRSGAHRRDRAAARHHRAMRAIASSAASTRPSSGPGSRSRPGWCSNCAAAKPPRSSSPALCRIGGAATCCAPERPARLGGLRCAAGGKLRRSSKRSAVRSSSAARRRSAVTPPSWRGDIEGEADLVEEVLRVKGYDEIPAVPLPRETVIAAPGDRCAARGARIGAPHPRRARPRSRR